MILWDTTNFPCKMGFFVKVNYNFFYKGAWDVGMNSCYYHSVCHITRDQAHSQQKKSLRSMSYPRWKFWVKNKINPLILPKHQQKWSQRKVKKSKKSTKDTAIDDFDSAFLCWVCGLSGNGTDRDKDWVGCDTTTTCLAWFHYKCLSYSDRTDVDLSFLTAGNCLCQDCKALYAVDNRMCPVCMAEINMATTYITSLAVCCRCPNTQH